MVRGPPTRRSKPAGEYVDVSPDREAPRLRGALRGLQPKNIIDDSEQDTAKLPSDDGTTAAKPQTKDTRPRRATRGKANYDSKFHPMDAFLRPNSAATRRHHFKSEALSHINADNNKDDKDFDAENFDAENFDDGFSGDELSSESPEHHAMPTPRTPHVLACRRSSRSASRKYHNYSTKLHPNDADIAGFEHNGRYLKAIEHLKSCTSEPSDKRRLYKSNSGVSGTSSSTLPAPSARKKVRSLASTQPSDTEAVTKSNQRSSIGAVLGDGEMYEQDSDIDDLISDATLGGPDNEDLVDEAVRFSQAPNRSESLRIDPDADSNGFEDLSPKMDEACGAIPTSTSTPFTSREHVVLDDFGHENNSNGNVDHHLLVEGLRSSHTGVPLIVSNGESSVRVDNANTAGVRVMDPGIHDTSIEEDLIRSAHGVRNAELVNHQGSPNRDRAFFHTIFEQTYIEGSETEGLDTSEFEEAFTDMQKARQAVEGGEFYPV